MMNTQVESLMQWYEHLDRQNLQEINRFYEMNAFFKDPFNEVQRLDSIKKIFEHMFDHLQNPKFKFIDCLHDGHQTFLTWDFTFVKSGKHYKIHGSSYLKWSGDQKIRYHRDYWDIGEELLKNLPIIGKFYTLLTNPLKVKE